MQDIQSIFNRLEKNKKEQKDLKSAYKEALSLSQEYQEINDKMKRLRERKKQIESTIKDQFAKELIKIDDLKIDIESDMELMGDIALTKMVKGETIEVKDEYDNEYEPLFIVKFKKVK